MLDLMSLTSHCSDISPVHSEGYGPFLGLLWHVWEPGKPFFCELSKGENFTHLWVHMSILLNSFKVIFKKIQNCDHIAIEEHFYFLTCKNEW